MANKSKPVANKRKPAATRNRQVVRLLYCATEQIESMAHLAITIFLSRLLENKDDGCTNYDSMTKKFAHCHFM